MFIPEDVLLDYIIFIAMTERRPVSYKDCLYFEFEEQEYRMIHGTFRNKISKLKKSVKVKKIYHSNIAFYKPVGYDVYGKGMTDNGAGISTNTPLYKLIKDTVLEKNAVHNIRLKFECKNIWNILSCVIENKYDILDSNKVSTFYYNDILTNPTTDIDIGIPENINPQSKDIQFDSLDIKGFKTDITIHKTDTVTIIISCSYNPIVLDSKGYVDFSALLVRIEERLARLVNDCSIYYLKIQKGIDYASNKISSNNTNDLLTNIASNIFIKIPSYENWIIIMCRFWSSLN